MLGQEGITNKKTKTIFKTDGGNCSRMMKLLLNETKSAFDV